MENQTTTTIRPYKWSSWDCEVWTREDNEKAYIFGEQKWADIDIEDEYVLTPIQFHSELGWCNPKDFMLGKEDDTDLVFVIDGESCTSEANDVYHNVEFRGDPKLEEEYKAFTEGKDYEPEYSILEQLGYEQVDGYHIVKFYQRKLGE